MIISIDFDGTIVREAYPKITELMPQACKYINRLYQEGHYIIINTCRSGQDLLEAINFMLDQEIPFNRVNDNEPEHCKEFKNNNSRKIFAHVYVDDRNLGGFPGWETAYNIISDMVEAQKNK